MLLFAILISTPLAARPKPAYGKYAKSSALHDAEEEAIANNLGAHSLTYDILTDIYEYSAGQAQRTGTSRKAVSGANPSSQAAQGTWYTAAI